MANGREIDHNQNLLEYMKMLKSHILCMCKFNIFKYFWSCKIFNGKQKNLGGGCRLHYDLFLYECHYYANVEFNLCWKNLINYKEKICFKKNYPPFNIYF